MKTNKDFFQLKRCQFVKNQWPVLLQMTELLIYFQTMYMFLHSALLWAGDAAPKDWIHSTPFSFLNLQLSDFTANTKISPKVMTGMNCWTGAGAEVAIVAAPGRAVRTSPAVGTWELGVTPSLFSPVVPQNAAGRQ